jgi:hypothetical protein
VQEILTFIGTSTGEKGVIHGVGKGIITTAGGGEGGEPEMVSLESSGSIKWRGCVFTRKQYYSKTSN